MSLSDAAVRNAKKKLKPYKITDAGGLYLLVTPAGGKLWRFKYRIEGKEKLLALGSYPEVPLASYRHKGTSSIEVKGAREMREDARELVAQGIDPSDVKRQKKLKASIAKSDSFEAVTAEWLAAQTWMPATRKKIERRMAKDIFPYLGQRPISSITPQELLHVVRKIEARDARESAHRALSECGGVFRYAVQTSRVEFDITRDLRGALKKVEKGNFAAIIDATEAGELMRAVMSYRGTPVVRAAIHLSALLFQRPGEIRTMLWSNIDLDAGTWKYVVTKSNKPHVVPLSVQAVGILRELHPLTGHLLAGKPNAPQFVFPGARSVLRPMSENAVRQALRNLGYRNEEMTAHGFRAMARTLLAECGWKPEIIERQLAHKAAGPLGDRYDRTRFLIERKEMMQAWADYLDGLRDGGNSIRGNFGRPVTMQLE